MQWMESDFNFKTNIPVDSAIHLSYNGPKVDLQSLEYAFSRCRTYIRYNRFSKEFNMFISSRYLLPSFADQDLPLQLGMNSRHGIFKAGLNPSPIFAIVYVYATIFTYLASHVGKLCA